MEQAGGRTWSANEWSEHRKGWIFITSRPTERGTLRPLHSLWIDLLVMRLLSRPRPGQKPVWFVIDELASLQQLPKLHTAITENRKSQNPLVLGFQGKAQLEVIYGHLAEVMLSQPATKIFLRTTEPKAAEWVSKAIGNIEIERLKEIALLRTAQPHAGVVTVVRPSSVPIPIHRYPARATWASAKTNGTIALLSVRQSAMYDLLDYRAEMAILSIDRSDIAALKFRSDMYRLGVDMSPGTTFSLPAAEVPSVISDIALAAAAMRTTAGWDANWLAGCEAVSAGVRTREDFLPYFDKERVAITSRFPKS